ncbi:Hypothetical predicted protein [Paramuricea clavata]|uniref:Uncharacterized protein n=1 Tax=Paramuricea clavata TaxID=317549 RepID=A0A6S7JZZ6_PARCT|nr:Hypothetical predicted protein [Paramuricea clavata]
MIEELHPPLPQIDLPQPPPPGEESQISATSRIIPLMDVKPYGYFHDYGSLWWGGPELSHATQPYFTEQSATIHESIHRAHENTEIRPNENNTTQTLEQNSLNLTQQADLEVEDEASELALREQLLKSMVTKRAAKNAGKVNEKSAAASVASPSNSRAPSPFAEPGTRKGLQEVVKNEATKAAKVQYT